MVEMAEVKSIDPQAGPQEDFLSINADWIIYGGSAGSGKTGAVALDFLRFYETKNVDCVLFRRTTPSIELPGATWDTFTRIYDGLPIEVRQHKHEIILPKKSKLKMTHLQYDNDVDSHHGAQYGVIYFEELQEFTRHQFFYMTSRNRSMSGIQPYIRATMNPDPDHFATKEFIDWYLDDNKEYPDPKKSGVIRYFVNLDDKILWGNSRLELLFKIKREHRDSFNEVKKYIQTFTFIPAKLSDNKLMEKVDPFYRGRLLGLDKVQRERLLYSNWRIKAKAGMLFPRSAAKIVDASPIGGTFVRFWDRAATEKKLTGKGRSNDPDWTVGLLMQKAPNGMIYIHDVQRFREGPFKVREKIKNVTSQDSSRVKVRLEQEPGSSGKADVDDLIRQLSGFDARAIAPTGDKVSRAGPLSAQWEAGNVFLIRGNWNEELLKEMDGFPDVDHDDQVDAASGAFNALNEASIPGIGFVGAGDERDETGERLLDYGDDD